MEQLAIKGHETRGKEVIEILEMLGGKISPECGYEDGFDSHYVYFIDTNENYYIDGLLLIGDKNPTKLSIFTLEEFLEKYPYKVKDKVLYKRYKTPYFIRKMFWEKDKVLYELSDEVYSDGCSIPDTLIFDVDVAQLQPYKEETIESKPNLLQQLKEHFDNTPRDVLEKEWNELSYLNEIGPTVDEYLECVKKYRQLNQYPNTYEECCEVLGCKADDFFTNFGYNGCDVEVSDYEDKIDDLLQNFRKLRYCRDAYWKIAGEQMGLGKPWEPDYKDGCIKYTITVAEDEIYTDVSVIFNYVLIFPTEEMRDTFYENFKELIEIVKELI